MERFVAFAATLVVVAASAGESDVSSAGGGMSLSFPSSRLWAAPDPANVAMRNAMAGSDTSAVFAEYHANLAHAGLAAADLRDNQIEKERMTERVNHELEAPSRDSGKLPGRLDGLLQENVPQHTGDHVLDRLAALHELVERKRAMRHAQHGDLIPGNSDQNAFLQPSPPYPGPDASFNAPMEPKPLASFTETAAAFPPSRPMPSSDGLLDPAEMQDGTLNQDGTHVPAASSFSASPMSRASTASALGRGDAIMSNLDSVVSGLKKVHGLRGASNGPPSSQPLAQSMQWPPSLAPTPSQASIPPPLPSFSAAPHAQMDPNFAAAIGAAAPDLAQPMSMSFNLPPAGPSGSDKLPDLPPKSTDNMMSPVQALMTNTDSGFGLTSLPAPVQASPPAFAHSPSPNGARLFEAPPAANPATPSAMAPISLPAASPMLTGPLDAQKVQVPQAAQVIAPAGVFQPPLPPLSSAPVALPSSMAPVTPSSPVPVFQPPVPPLSSVSSSSEPVPLGGASSSVDTDLQRVNQTTAEDEREIERIQAQMAASNPDVKLWIPNAQPAPAQPKVVPPTAKMPTLTATVPQAPVANRVQQVPQARAVASHMPSPTLEQPRNGASAVGSAPITPVFDADGNRIDADNEAMLHDLKGEVANFEQRVSAMEHQEASLLQTSDDEQ
eukprot:gnl/MRDRNA2_/MRDRNA2_112281_c0_seq1.p1 gnl/MRDRNA2_/MRDRNA2_112281_c0~~gnl/MRDRNA2_/MRDRNA2_112281_c0_seq1.p1  ORF type:complete len:668 (-),score=168.83 gnl/MRDRNA2_/MRDRNA2_112281_c0_seq1:13-2016(-)